MPVYQTTFEIHAPASRVWQVLTALASYGDWNPQISDATGTIQAGATIFLRLALPARPALALSAMIEEAQHVEDIHGLLAPAFALVMGGPIQRSHEALNRALRARAESANEVLPFLPLGT